MILLSFLSEELRERARRKRYPFYIDPMNEYGVEKMDFNFYI